MDMPLTPKLVIKRLNELDSSNTLVEQIQKESDAFVCWRCKKTDSIMTFDHDTNRFLYGCPHCSGKAIKEQWEKENSTKIV